MNRTRVKICGITRPEDALAAVAAGADAIGLVFYPASARAVSVYQAEAICAQLPPFVTVVALTVNATHGEVTEILEALPNCVLQFHGDENPAHCERFARPYIKAIRMRADVDLAVELQRFSTAQALLLDTYQKGKPGGTGEVFNWDLIPSGIGPRIILAGGLNPDNVQQAICTSNPYAVDVSGGVEVSAGVKDIGKLNDFVSRVTQAGSVE